MLLNSQKDLITIAVSFIGALCLYCLRLRLHTLVAGHHGSMFPPPNGPPSWPLIGNILSLPIHSAWLKLTEYQQIYGDLIKFHCLGQNLVVINSMKIAVDLLEKRGEIYSSRPKFTMAGELMGLDKSMPLLSYGREWREHRKLAFFALGPIAVKKFHPVQENLATLLCRDLLDNPEGFVSAVRLTSGRIILSITYGISVGSADNEYITHAEATMQLISRSTVPGAYLCDLVPILKYLPSWIPFRREGEIGKKMIERLVTEPFEHVKNRMNVGASESSMVYDLLSMEPDHSDQFEHKVKWTAGAMYGAGAETTYSTILVFLMAMALNPDKQAVAYAEINRIVGYGRLPLISDMPSLPYINAVLKETMRWHPVLPLSIARRSDKEDFYEGRRIPEGTIILPNIWAIAFGPNEKYPPKDFIPERFLDTEIRVADPENWAFGFGRRDCPGKHLAKNSIFILMSCILASFEIAPHVDQPIVPEYYGGLISFPKPFKCRLLPRPHARDILQQNEPTRA